MEDVSEEFDSNIDDEEVYKIKDMIVQKNKILCKLQKKFVLLTIFNTIPNNEVFKTFMYNLIHQSSKVTEKEYEMRGIKLLANIDYKIDISAKENVNNTAWLEIFDAASEGIPDPTFIENFEIRKMKDDNHIPFVNMNTSYNEGDIVVSNQRSFKCYKLQHTFQANSNNEFITDVHIGAFKKVEMGFVYTTDVGIKTGVPYTHNKFFKYTSHLSLHDSHFETFRNTFDNAAFFDLGSCYSILESKDIRKCRMYVMSIIETCMKIHESSAVPEMLVAYVLSPETLMNIHELKRLIHIRCLLMGIIKLFPIK